MTKYLSLRQQQGHYRYDPNGIEQKGAARLFPYSGEDGSIRYLVKKLYENLLNQGSLSEPWSLLLRQLEKSSDDLQENWQLLSTLLVDCQVFQSGWFNFDLPPNEQFNSSYVEERKKLVERLMAAIKAVETVDKNLPVIQRKDQQRKLFFQAFGNSRPVVSWIHEVEGGLTDREFVRQRLAGANPLVLRRVQAIDQGLIQSLAGEVNSIDLIKSAGENRLFIADYPLLKDLKVTDLQLGKYVGNPVALFYRNEQGLEPILIQVVKGKVVTTGTGEEWAKAKLYFQAADATHHQLVSHLCYTHLAMEPLAIATPRQLPYNHPVYQLLSPHFQFLLAINHRANTVLLDEDGAINKLTAPTRTASTRVINQAYREKSFWYYSLLNDIELRGIESKFLPDFPYRDDALLLWGAIAKYATQYLQRYYPDDKAVQQDPYLLSWAEELGAPLNTRPKTDFPQVPPYLPKEWIAESGIEPQELPTHPRIPGFTKIGSLQQLIDIATIVIFTCGPQHAAVNFSQFDYLSYVPNAPLATYSHPNTPATLEELLPPPEMELLQMRLASTLGGIYWGNLGSSDLIKFADKNDRQILEQFQNDLWEIEGKIKARNQQRLETNGVDYPYLLPSRIPNSINI
ncbi:lipoxygenase family protein [Cronbergia sp. UHCC 0137]|uniref:lipoxygenase family protein n=1 Tax=Cronbergia sp. UHCC 0137 TaxID=3110239 RepID=UPI002B21C819|nr:lipoxygenase family protein [Cronbergia sp. UHCC 0137]MEA5620682.1 lipoxygenase family protein [Cronbergia sp. UHCC 0137]